MHELFGGFEYAARESRRELLQEARERRLARLARSRRSFHELVAPALRFMARRWDKVRSRSRAEGAEIVTGEASALAYVTLEPSEGAETAVEIFLEAGGCVVRKTNLRTGASTDAFVADGKVKK